MTIRRLSIGFASLAALACRAQEEYVVEEVFPAYSAATLTGVLSFCIDDAGDFVIVDSASAIAHMTPYKEIIKRLPINGEDVATDSEGNIYVLGLDGRVHKFDAGGAFVTRWGGSGFGIGQFQDACDIETDGEGDVYVLDKAEGNLERFNSEGDPIREWRGFQRPHGFGIDRKNGFVYVCDTGAASVRKFERDGRPILQWGKPGGGNGQFTHNSDAAVDGDGYISIVDDALGRIQQFDEEGNYLDRTEVPGLSDARIGIDGAGNLYVSDMVGRVSGHLLLKIAPDGGRGSGLADLLQGPVEARPLGDQVYFLENASRQVRRWDRKDGSIREVIRDAGTIGEIESFVLDPGRGLLYAADTPNGRILKYDLGGNLLAEWTGEGCDGSKMVAPRALAIDGEGNVVAVDASDRHVRRFDAQGRCVARFAGGDVIYSPKGIAVGGGGAIYVSDIQTDSILKFGRDGTFLFSWGMRGAGVGQFGNPWGVATDRQGSVYVADHLNYRIQKFDSNGVFIAEIEAKIDGKRIKPFGVDVDPRGDVVAADNANHRLVRLRRRASFVRGDGNGDGSLDLGDPVFLLNFLFASGPAPDCFDSVDIDDDGRLTIGDAVSLLNFLFAGGGAPRPPYPDPGIDPTEDDLGCVGD